MKKLTSIVLLSAMIVGTFAVSATAATKQATHYTESELKSMDTNKDGMVSKDEYMAHSEMAFGKMKLTDGMISLKNKSKSNSSTSSTSKPADDASSMNNKPIGTTTDNPTVNERDATSGKTY